MYRNTMTVSKNIDIDAIVDKVLKNVIEVQVQELLPCLPEIQGRIVDLLRNHRQMFEGPKPLSKPKGPLFVSVNRLELDRPLYA